MEELLVVAVDYNLKYQDYSCHRGCYHCRYSFRSNHPDTRKYLHKFHIDPIYRWLGQEQAGKNKSILPIRPILPI
jgi:hypothetical protein